MSRFLKSRFLKPLSIGFLLSLPIAAIVLFSMGFTHGEEFSPDDFSQRGFYYNRIPILKWTIIGKQYVNTTSDFQKSLLSDGLITPPSNTAKTWHLCRDSDGGFDDRPPRECDSRFLVDYLQLPGTEANSLWQQWNEQHPALAKVFWPIIADVARQERYLLIPDLMRLAMAVESNEKQPDDVESFESQLQTILQQ